MSWKKELLRGMVELRGEVARQQSVIAAFDLMVRGQQRMIERLLDRLQAKDFKELKSFTVPMETEIALSRVGEVYNPLGDEDMAGMVVRDEGEIDG